MPYKQLLRQCLNDPVILIYTLHFMELYQQLKSMVKRFPAQNESEIQKKAYNVRFSAGDFV